MLSRYPNRIIVIRKDAAMACMATFLNTPFLCRKTGICMASKKMFLLVNLTILDSSTQSKDAFFKIAEAKFLGYRSVSVVDIRASNLPCPSYPTFPYVLAESSLLAFSAERYHAEFAQLTNHPHPPLWRRWRNMKKKR